LPSACQNINGLLQALGNVSQAVFWGPKWILSIYTCESHIKNSPYPCCPCNNLKVIPSHSIVQLQDRFSYERQQARSWCYFYLIKC